MRCNASRDYYVGRSAKHCGSMPSGGVAVIKSFRLLMEDDCALVAIAMDEVGGDGLVGDGSSLHQMW